MPGRVLFVVYYFPPLGGGGVFRPLKFVKYLPQFGWTPYVLTIADDPHYIHDFSLLQEVPGTVPVERVANRWDFRRLDGSLSRLRGGWRLLRLLSWFEIPDDKVGWIIPAYQRAWSLIRKHGINAIYTTSAPYCNHLLGYRLKRKTGLPWVADFRDEWAKRPDDVYRPALHRWLSAKLERMVVNQADHIVSVCDPIIALLKNGVTNEPKFTTITNGFDAADIVIARARALPRPDSYLRFVYTGSFYGHIAPTHFIEALEGLLEQGTITPDEVRVRLIGRLGSKKSFRRPEWQRVLECPGYLAHGDALIEHQQADCLLLFIPQERGAYAYTGKVFEYIASGKPILALVPPDGMAADIIRKSRTGIIVAPDDLQAIKSAILSLFKQWKVGRLAIQPDDQVIQRFERRHLTGQLAAILDAITDGPPANGSRRSSDRTGSLVRMSS